MDHVHPHQPHTSEALLDPADRISEVLFGVIMVLTFTWITQCRRGGTG
jgi:hypothetical protein